MPRWPGSRSTELERHRLVRWTTLALGALFTACGPPSEPPPSPQPSETPPPSLQLVFVGIDGADWESLQPLLDEGVLPHFASLIARSETAPLYSPPPRISPLLWTSILTGTLPEEHRVLDFFEPGPDDQPVAVSSRSRQVPAVWNILDHHGLRPAVVGFWATWPAESIHGIVVSDRYAPSLFETTETPDRGIVSPPQWGERLRRLPSPDRADELIERFVGAAETVDPDAGYADPVVHLRAILGGALRYHQAAMEILTSEEIDVLFVYYQMIDEVGHRFMHYAPPPQAHLPPDEVARFGAVMREAYLLQDQLLGELLASCEASTPVLLVSDHGFLSGERRPPTDPADFAGQAATWHRDEGIAIASGLRLPSDVYDVVPAILDALDVPDRSAGDWSPPEKQPEPDVDARARLEALGYVDPSSTPEAVTASGYINLGLSLAHRGEHERAQAAYGKALEVFPDHPMALYDLASSLQDHAGHREAFDHLVRLARLDTALPTGALTPPGSGRLSPSTPPIGNVPRQGPGGSPPANSGLGVGQRDGQPSPAAEEAQGAGPGGGSPAPSAGPSLPSSFWIDRRTRPKGRRLAKPAGPGWRRSPPIECSPIWPPASRRGARWPSPKPPAGLEGSSPPPTTPP